MKHILLALAVAFILSGCISSNISYPQEIYVRKLDLSVSNFSEMLKLGVPVVCAVKPGNQTTIVKVRDGVYRADFDKYSIIKNGSMVYMRVPLEKKAEIGCDWVLVNKSEDVFAQVAEFYPADWDVESIKSNHFLCEVAYVNPRDFVPDGKLCWYFDLT